MATAGHADAMSLGREQDMPTAGVTLSVAASAGDRNLHASPEDRQPTSGWAECFSQDGILPTLLLLLTFAGLWRRFASAAPRDTPRQVGERAARFLHPPPLEPSRRRALLQVFLN